MEEKRRRGRPRKERVEDNNASLFLCEHNPIVPEQTQSIDTTPTITTEVTIPDGTNLNSRSWMKFQVLVSEKVEEDEPLLFVGEQIILSRGNMACIIGKPKSGKTFLTSAMCGAAILGDYMGIKCPTKDLKIVIFDTEQGRSRTQKVQKRIHQICYFDTETPYAKLFSISIREVDSAERLRIVKDAIADINPDLVIIDGVRDLLSNFNDVNESSALVNDLLRITEVHKCGMINIIHQNKGDTNARGHLGSELMNKSESALEVKMSDKIATVSPVHCRNVEFESFSFRIDEEGLPVPCDYVAPKKRVSDEVEELIDKAMENDTELEKAELIKRIKLINNRGDKTADRRIKDAIEQGIIRINKGVVELIDDEDE